MALKNTIEVREHFRQIVGLKPWRARLGWGSFLTFDFGQKVKRENHYYGGWHLWIRYCNWILETDKRNIVDSESPRRLIQNAVRNLEKYTLRDVQFDAGNDRTIFLFDANVRLVCTPYPDQSPDEDFWTLFLPNQILTVGPKHRIELQQSSEPRYPARASS